MQGFCTGINARTKRGNGGGSGEGHGPVWTWVVQSFWLVNLWDHKMESVLTLLGLTFFSTEKIIGALV